MGYGKSFAVLEDIGSFHPTPRGVFRCVVTGSGINTALYVGTNLSAPCAVGSICAVAGVGVLCLELVSCLELVLCLDQALWLELALRLERQLPFSRHLTLNQGIGKCLPAHNIMTRLPSPCRTGVDFSFSKKARLARSPPTKAIRVQSPAGALRIFACGNPAGRMSLVSGLSWGSPVSPAPLLWRCSILSSITLIGSQDLNLPWPSGRFDAPRVMLRETRSVMQNILQINAEIISAEGQERVSRQRVSFITQNPAKIIARLPIEQSFMTCVLEPYCKSSSQQMEEFIAGTEWMTYSFPSPLASSPCRSGLNPRPGHSGFSHVGILPDDAVGWRVFSGISRFPLALSSRRCSILTSVPLIDSQDLDVKSHPNLFTHLSSYDGRQLGATALSSSKVYSGTPLFHELFEEFHFLVSNVRSFSFGVRANNANWMLLSPYLHFVRSFLVDAPVPISSLCSGSPYHLNGTSLHRSENQLGHEGIVYIVPGKNERAEITSSANRVRSSAGSPGFRKWGWCLTMALVGGFYLGYPVSPPPLHSRRRSIST
ncbi:hypothetical protein PR048_033257 [Dryococelus australis]|uniref:Uncharacterized protein n=1 Tax=Dryococelus australis TaxID=614101 RepID=A0ABQ9G2M5_9NEOP|nr:hypothetical protein PR048_033257 [Dryococelus australis]